MNNVPNGETGESMKVLREVFMCAVYGCFIGMAIALPFILGAWSVGMR